MKPNIVILLIDALRAKNMSLHGYPHEFDRNIKRIASESLMFTNHFSCANATYPSLTSLFTGKYPVNHGVVHNMPHTSQDQLEKLKKNKFWLPMFLQKQGYETFLFSLTGGWFRKGFDYIQEEKKKDTYRKINDKKLVKKILKIIPDPVYVSLKKMIGRDPKTDFPKPKETVDLAISKVKEAKQPFFMFLHFEDVHYPWATTPTPKAEGGKSKKELLQEIKDNSQKKYVQRRMFNTSTNSSAEVEGKYNKALETVDVEAGRFYDFLKEKKILDKTIFIVMSDHGFSIAEHGIYLNHTGLYDETIHVPLLMKLPGTKPKQIDELVQNVDLVPTILDLIGKKNSEPDGNSLLPLIKKGTPIRNKAFSFDGSCANRWSIRTKNRKLIFTADPSCFSCKSKHGEEIEEYDLNKDPQELDNIHKGKHKLTEFRPDFELK